MRSIILALSFIATAASAQVTSSSSATASCSGNCSSGSFASSISKSGMPAQVNAQTYVFGTGSAAAQAVGTGSTGVKAATSVNGSPTVFTNVPSFSLQNAKPVNATIAPMTTFKK
mgnify:CR=1 FL=1